MAYGSVARCDMLWYWGTGVLGLWGKEVGGFQESKGVRG